MTYIDLTHTVTDGMAVFPGDAKPAIAQVSSIDAGGFNNFSISTPMHVGTHIDGALHMLAGGKKLSEYPVSHFFGMAHLIDARGQTRVLADLLDGHTIKPGDMVVVWTDSYKKFGTEAYFNDYPEISADFARALVNKGVKMLAIDTPSPDRAPYPIHKTLLENDVLIVENLNNVADIKVESFQLIALPAKFDADSAPCRAVAAF